MSPSLIQRLCCPVSHEPLVLAEAEYESGRIRSGLLVSSSGKTRYPIRDFIPRFVPVRNYADNFGMQWNSFRRTQLDSYSGQKISSDRFWRATGWTPHLLRNRLVLDAGCGAGRFAEVALKTGAEVIAIDYSNAVDACRLNHMHHPNLHVVQADIYNLPFRRASFAFVYSLGVLQHTPDVAAAFAALPLMLESGGRLCVDFYERSWKNAFHPKYWLRPITRRMPPDRLFAFLRAAVPPLLALSQIVGMIPGVGRAARRFVPVANYHGVFPLTAEQHREWALLDTFDWFAPAFDSPQRPATVRLWLAEAGLIDCQVEKAGHLVGRGRRS